MQVMWPSTHAPALWRGVFVDHDNITDITTYLRAHAVELGGRILETFPPLQSTKDPIAPAVASLLRKALPAQGLAITGTAKYLRQAKAARIVAECGAGKTYMALGTIHVLTAGGPSTTLVMCPSHITHKWAREVLLTIPRARAFLIEDMRNGGDPKKQHGICEVKLSKGRTVYEGKHLTLAEMRRMGRREWRERFPGPVFFITGKDKGKLGYFWDHAYLKAKSGPNLGSIVNPDSGLAILDSERQKLTHLDFDDKVKMSETLVSPNQVEAVDDLIFNAGPSWAPNHFADDHLKQAIRDLLASADNTGCSPELTVVAATVLEAVRSRMPEF